MVSGFVTSPEDQSRICLLDASPMRMASKSLMSIKLVFLPCCSERVRHPVREGLGRRPRVCARPLSFLDLLGRRRPRRRAQGARSQVDAEFLRGAEQLVILLADLNLLALVRKDVDVERQGLH